MSRIWLVGTVCLLLALSVVEPARAASANQPAELAAAIHQRALVLDTHVDIAGPQYATDALDPGVDNPQLQCDLVKMQRGGVDGVFLAVYVGQGPCTPEGYAKAMEAALGKFEAIDRLTERYPDRCQLARRASDVRRIVASGRRAIMIGVENGYPIGEDLENLDKLYELGARYMTLSHNGHNQICDSCNPRSELGDGPSRHGGLSPFGERVVRRMNRLGMMIDVSHIAPAAFWDVIRLSRAPVIASHAGCRALCDNTRNLDDDQLRALAANGGVIQVVALGAFLKKPSPERLAAIRRLAEQLELPWRRGRADLSGADQRRRDAFRQGMERINRELPLATVRDFVDHIDHAVRIAGVDHVGVGTDFDGGGGIAGFEDHGQAAAVTAELLGRGYTEQQIVKIWGGNLLRVWRAVERTGRR